jgi:mannose-6-phosphate isomerase-like protein (cupin superfamily)
MAEPVSKSARRRIVTGFAADGMPTMTSDAPPPVTLETPLFDIVETWRIDSLPADLGLDETVVGAAAIDPLRGQILCRFCYFAPSQERSHGEWAAAMESFGASAAYDSNAARPGTHQTDTLDHVLVVSGEITLIVGDHETVVKAGDTVVQRGTPHAWVNHTDAPCVTFAVQVPADISTRMSDQAIVTGTRDAA